MRLGKHVPLKAASLCAELLKTDGCRAIIPAIQILPEFGEAFTGKSLPSFVRRSELSRSKSASRLSIR